MLAMPLASKVLTRLPLPQQRQPKLEIRPAGMANGDRDSDAVQPRRPHDDDADWRHASAEPSCRERVFNPERKDHHGGKRKLPALTVLI